ncbi:MAG TPA: hypothetical protein VKZ78_06285 [Sphingobacteriaceae bacterium]|nr:hypothetical protein [Sphingobacteriaceae bacterium]
MTPDPVANINEQEQILLEKAESDIADGQVKKFRSHREILSQGIPGSGQ